HLAHTGHARQDVAGPEHHEVAVVLVQRPQHLVGGYLATLVGVGALHPVAAHLPALVHVGIHLAVEFLRLLDEILRHTDTDGLIVNGHIQYHWHWSCTVRFHRKGAKNAENHPIFG